MAIPVDLDGESDNYIIDHYGKIIEVDTDEDDESKAVVAGHVRASRVYVGLMVERGEDIGCVFDAKSQTMLGFYENLFSGDELKSSVCEGSAGSDILIVESVEILPAYRGKHLGLKTMRRVMDFLGSGCAVTTIQAHPIPYNKSLNKEWAQQMGVERFTRDKKTAAKKLRDYWSRLGFQRIGRTDFMALDMAYGIEDLPEDAGE